jgi:hypothetical protein
MLSFGRPKVFSYEEEILYAAFAIDPRYIAKEYLHHTDQGISCFKKKKIPVTEWVVSVMNCHMDAPAHRSAQNITLQQAVVGDIISEFCYDLDIELTGIPALNIWNYGKINLVDDPGIVSVIT